MAIWKLISESLAGGFKTHGPNQLMGAGAFDTPDGDYEHFSQSAAMKLSALFACVSLRAEVIGSLPLHLRGPDFKPMKDHPLYHVLHVSPNAFQTAPEYWSMNTAFLDMKGNAISRIDRIGGRVSALVPADPDDVSFEFNKSGSRRTWFIGKDEFADDDILHLKGFSLDGMWGDSRLDLGRQIISAQLAANKSALRAFKQGLKVGGFFKVTKDLDPTKLKDFRTRLDEYGKPENIGKWMALLAGVEPVAGTQFAVKPSDAQLLESRYFGIEEICRLMNVPPQLIGHTNKASSWASSIENVNLHFVIYSLAPTVVRNERSIAKKLISRQDLADGVEAKWSLQGLMRGDTKARMAYYAAGKKDGWLNSNEIRAFEEMGEIPGGDEYHVQAQMVNIDKTKDNPDEATDN